MSVIPQSKHEVVEALRASSQQLQAFGVHRLGLFGSFRRDEATPTSDVDLLVEFEPGRKSFDSFMELSFFLEDLLQRSVELVTPESLSPYIGPRILSDVEYVTVAA